MEEKGKNDDIRDWFKTYLLGVSNNRYWFYWVWIEGLGQASVVMDSGMNRKWIHAIMCSLAEREEVVTEERGSCLNVDGTFQ